MPKITDEPSVAWQRTKRLEYLSWVICSMLVVALLGGIVFAIYRGVQNSDERSTKLAHECITSGGTWIQGPGDCVAGK